jgi:exopolysaccharide biosynthesis polyprenyl glycosylphosphotransferase
VSVVPEVAEVGSSETIPQVTSGMVIDLTTVTRRRILGRHSRQGSPQSRATANPVAAASLGAVRWMHHYQRLLVVADTVVLIATLSAFRVAANSSATTGHELLGCTLLLSGWLLTLLLGRCYERRVLGSGSQEFRRVLEACLRFAALAVLMTWLGQPTVARGSLLGALLLGLILLLAERAAARLFLRHCRRRGLCLHRVLAVGLSEDIEHLVRESRRASPTSFQVVGACVPGGQRSLSTPGGPTAVAGRPEDAAQVVREVSADILAVTNVEVLGREGVRRLAWQLEGSGTRLLLVPPLTDVARPRVTIHPLAGLPVLHVDAPCFSGICRFFKDACDRLAAFAALVVLSPLLVAIAVGVKLTSPGPVFYRQDRVGRRGRTFSCLKFRSMYADAEARLEELHAEDEGNGVLFKLRHDPRVTSFGRPMRRYSLDELPQLFNVLHGTMSLVGPRPPLPKEVDQYDCDVLRRLLVKPGITGLWQVSGRSDLSWAESVRLDLYYVENWSPGLDLHILARTVLAVATGRGAY